MKPVNISVGLTNKAAFLRQLINTYAGNGTIFSVTNVKKDGTLRKYAARLGVKKHLRGGESTTKGYDNLLTIYDMSKAGNSSEDKSNYRSLNLDTVIMLELNGMTYVFIDDNVNCPEIATQMDTSKTCIDVVLDMIGAAVKQ